MLKPNQSIVFEGDSLSSRRRGANADTWSFLRMANWHQTYAELVEDWLFVNLPELNLKMRHAAIGGSSIIEMQKRYETTVKPHEPGLLIFTIGNNDPHRMELAEFTDRLDAYLDQLQRDSSTTMLYIGEFEPCPGADASVEPRCEAAAPFNQEAARQVTARGGEYLKVGSIMRSKAEALYAQSDFHRIYAEGRHLNLIGATMLATQVLRTLGAFRMIEDQP